MKDDETITTMTVPTRYRSVESRPRKRKHTLQQSFPRQALIVMLFKSLLVSFVKIGWRRYISWSDGEFSLAALETVHKESLVGDHTNSIGEAENAVKDIKSQVCVLKVSLEENLQQHVAADHPNLTWLRRQGANCPTRYRIEEDGKTGEQGRTGKQWLQAALEFGERSHLRPARAQDPRSGLQPPIPPQHP